MAGSNGSLGFLVVAVIVAWLALLIIAPAAYLMVGPDELRRIWQDFISR